MNEHLRICRHSNNPPLLPMRNKSSCRLCLSRKRHACSQSRDSYIPMLFVTVFSLNNNMDRLGNTGRSCAYHGKGQVCSATCSRRRIQNAAKKPPHNSVASTFQAKKNPRLHFVQQESSWISSSFGSIVTPSHLSYYATSKWNAGYIQYYLVGSNATQMQLKCNDKDDDALIRVAHQKVGTTVLCLCAFCFGHQLHHHY